MAFTDWLKRTFETRESVISREVDERMEKREASYTDAIVQALLAQAQGTDAAPRSVSPVEVAAGYWGAGIKRGPHISRE